MRSGGSTGQAFSSLASHPPAVERRLLQVVARPFLVVPDRRQVEVEAAYALVLRTYRTANPAAEERAS